MSADHTDWLIWDDRRCRVLTRPLHQHRVTWVLEDDRLYIRALDAVPVAELFPEQPEVMPADWYSGTLRLAEGEIHGDLGAGGPAYERETCLVLENGAVVARTEVTLGSPASVEGSFREEEQ